MTPAPRRSRRGALSICGVTGRTGLGAGPFPFRPGRNGSGRRYKNFLSVEKRILVMKNLHCQKVPDIIFLLRLARVPGFLGAGRPRRGV